MKAIDSVIEPAEESKFGLRGALSWTFITLWRPFRGLFRWLLFGEDMRAIAKRFDERGQALRPESGSREFAAQLRAVYPRFNEFIREAILFFERKAGPNYISYLIADPLAKKIESYEVTVRRVRGLTQVEIISRLDRGLRALAAADIRRLEKAGMPTAVFTAMILSTVYQVDPPLPEISYQTISEIANGNIEVLSFLMFYNATLEWRARGDAADE